MPWKEVNVYGVVQTVAGVCAGLYVAATRGKVANFATKTGFGWGEAFLAQIPSAFVLRFVVLDVAAFDKNGCGSPDGKQQFYGRAFGFVVIAGGYGARSISGGAFNTAVALSLDVSHPGVGFG